MSDLGEARGRVVIDTSQLGQAQQQVRQASQQMTNSFQQSGAAFRTLGVTLGVAGVVQFARAAVAVNELATSYARQSVAARNLAGSQEQLNALLETYENAVGGSVSRSEALVNVTKLMAVGFADDTEELDKFARSIRGISLAMGRTEDFVTQNLILELFSQRGMRLDQLGLQYDKVRAAAEQLRAADRGLTQEQAYQIAVLDQANERFGALADSAAGQKTEVEQLADAWRDLQLAIGEATKEPIEGAAGFFTQIVERFTQPIENANKLLDDYVDEANRRFGQRTSIGRVTPQAFGTGGGFTQDQSAAITEWAREVAGIERQANRERLDATRQYEQQRTETIRQYEQTIAREAQDFAIGRARAEEDYALGLQRMHRDIAQREARQLEDLERTIADARTDAAERGAERQADLNERIAENRAASQERILELEADFARRRERAQRSHARSLRDAAANLDAVRVRELQRDFRESQQEAQEDFDTRLEKERKNEAKRLADLEKANAKQTEADKKAFDKRIQQAQDAYQRQLEDARAADEQRLADQSADFALRQAREDEDRAIRLQRLAEDHIAQLEEQARQHEARLIQIAEQEQEETQLANEAFDERMAELDIFHAGVREREAAHYARGLVAYQQYLDAQAAELARRTAIQGPTNFLPATTPGGVPSFASPSVAPSSITNSSSSTRSNTVNILPGAVSIVAPADLALDQRAVVWFHNMLADFFENQPQ